ncbi:hypothetical protein ABU614_10485 [Lysobacter firmicutimachus]|uniref:Uncharacterized protein n=1 Tax=Lysobacter firmicutimachus TaxID=1792846 RepID=A0AAU8N123_9GAMM
MKTLFGGLISMILLGVYVHLISVAVRVVDCVSGPGCTLYPLSYFNDGMAQALSVIGGLVSALVIAELALAKPGEAPGARVLDAGASANATRAVTVVSVLYVLVWIGAGLCAFLVGLYHPKELPALTTHGQAWLGLAVSAAYAYFGLSPKT